MGGVAEPCVCLSTICVGLTKVAARRIHAIGVHITKIQTTGRKRLITVRPGEIPMAVVGERDHPTHRAVFLIVIPG
ncbi:MAG: hypothetical protein WBC88_09970, partial [Candidatus Zixiibacteriota bacterium]